MPRPSNPSQFLNERLKLSAIPPEAAGYAGIETMTAAQARAKGFDLPASATDGFLIPYYDLRGKLIKGMWRWRNNPAAATGFRALAEPRSKYTQPKGTGCWPYFPRMESWNAVVKNPQEIPIVLVEGELKALSVSLAARKNGEVNFVAVGLGGVWNWTLNKELLPELRELAPGREFLIAFDSDADDNRQVAAARYWLARALLDARAKPSIVKIPHRKDDPFSPDKTGVDDLIRLEKSWRGPRLLEELASWEPNHRLYKLSCTA